ncbi:MAG: MoxR family ATPase [Candidatus Thermoplasmatota archaeon]|jgi:MoxR-like ATPase|nr:MoxR family ATPase [Candidatus Thermoplasmatota archaeon]
MTEINSSDLMELRNTVKQIQLDMGKVVVGSERIVRFMFIALMSGNHILLEGVPGLAKTMLASQFAKEIGIKFNRIQFTPDMLPSDITGSIVFNLESRKMEFRQGPIFSNLILADEINRTPAKVQSALLEAMEEHRVSVGGEDHILPEPYLVIATQNPVEQEGTFPLAEALMDRFLFRYNLTYPSREEEINILNSITNRAQIKENLMNADQILKLRSAVDNVFISQDVKIYIVDLIRRTRESDMVYLGASPRTTAKYLKAVRANALINGRNYVIPEDIVSISRELLNHRIILKPEAMIDGSSDPVGTVNSIIDRIVGEVEIPT